MKTFGRLVFSRVLIIFLLIVLQLWLVAYGLIFLSNWSIVFYVLFYLLGVSIAFWILNHERHEMYQLSWVILVLLLPVLGGVLYLLLGTQGTWKNVRHNLRVINKRLDNTQKSSSRITQWLKKTEPDLFKQVEYLGKEAGAEVFDQTESHFYANDQAMWQQFLSDLNQAQNFIFLEFFIIETGEIWKQVSTILEAKAQSGVEVRVLFDDAGSVVTLDQKDRNCLLKKGIKAQTFNRMRPFLDNRINNRDHRKIVVIDGRIGWTGGFNLADCYANLIEKHGHWYDSGLRLQGDGVWGLTRIFLESWNADHLRDAQADIDNYHHGACLKLPFEGGSNLGLVQSFGGQPYQNVAVNRDAYLNLINQAKKEVVITTPYLILDEVVVNALQTTARSGVRVKMILPKICDHWYISISNRGNYAELQKAGVEIYEYQPGFIHAKTCLVDEQTAIVGSTNFDCRSFYSQFEVGVLLWKTPAVAELKVAQERVLAQSKLMAHKNPRQDDWRLRLTRGCLRVIEPLM